MRVRHVHAPRWALATQLTYRCHLDQLLLAIAESSRLWAEVPFRTPKRPLHVIGDEGQLTPWNNSAAEFTLPLVSMGWVSCGEIFNNELEFGNTRRPVDIW